MAECEQGALARGLCSAHYQRAWRAGSLTSQPYKCWPNGVRRRCTVAGCGQPHHTNGLCGMHHQRQLRIGSVDLNQPEVLGSGAHECPECRRRFHSFQAVGAHRGLVHDVPRDREAALRRYYESNRAVVIRRSREWAQSHPDQHKILRRRTQARRKQRIQDAGGHTTQGQLEARLQFYGHRCWLCGDPWQEWDHVIPVSRGGTDWPANLRPACGPCNRRKHASLPGEIREFRSTPS